MAKRECDFVKTDSEYLDQLEKAHEKANAECMELEKQVREKDILIDEQRKRIMDLEKQTRGLYGKIEYHDDLLVDLEKKNVELKSHLEFTEWHLNSFRESCDRLVKENRELKDKSYAKENEDLKHAIDEKNDTIFDLQKKLNQAHEDIMNLTKENDELRIHNAEQAKSIIENEKEIEGLNKQIHNFRLVHDCREGFIDDQNRKIADMKKQLNTPMDTQYEELYFKFKKLWVERGHEINRLEQVVRKKNKIIENLERTMHKIRNGIDIYFTETYTKKEDY